MHLVLILRCQSTTHACRAGGDSKFLGRRGGENEPRLACLAFLYQSWGMLREEACPPPTLIIVV